MLDGRHFALLKIIDGECTGQDYKIFAFKDLSLAMPEEYSENAESAREIVKNLAAREYISVKYEDEFEVCLKPLAKGRFAFERALDEEVEKERDAKRYFLWSFLGAAAGGAATLFAGLMLFLLTGVAAC